MPILIREFRPEDHRPAGELFNHYVREGFSAFPDVELPVEFVQRLVEQARGFALYTVEVDGSFVGFGILRPLFPFPNMQLIGEVSYFLRPESTGSGIGTQLLERLCDRARELGMSSLVAKISSRNPKSLAFHKKNGFKRCARIREAGRKQGKSFDVIFMQKFLTTDNAKKP